MEAGFDSFAARASTKPCPNPSCGLIGTMTLSEEFHARPVDTYSLAGAQPKLSATRYVRITCGSEDVKGCGWNSLGEIEGNHFVVRSLKKEDNV